LYNNSILFDIIEIDKLELYNKKKKKKKTGNIENKRIKFQLIDLLS
jgi:hypothetical protein